MITCSVRDTLFQLVPSKGKRCEDCSFKCDTLGCVLAGEECITQNGIWQPLLQGNTLQEKAAGEDVKGSTEAAAPVVENARLDATEGIGDVNSTARGSGARFNAGKPDLSLIPLETLFDEARVWMHGEKKYARWNWQKGMAWSVPFACALRHLAAWQAGEDIDPESGQPHLAHVMCNLRMLTYYAKHYPEGDDRAPKVAA